MNRFVIIKSENNYELENKVNEFLITIAELS